MRFIIKEFAPGKASDYSFKFYDYEQYTVLLQEFSITVIFSVISVLTVILIISSNFLITFLVAMCICVTDILLMGLVYYWHLTFNPMVNLQIVLSIGTSVDFSAHIAYAYLVEHVPEKYEKILDTPSKIRVYKA